MPSFRTDFESDFGRGRRGILCTAKGDVLTPAFFPVLNLIGGPTTRSGGIWSRTRNRLFANPDFQGAMFQAMSFLDFGVEPGKLDTWREKPLHEHYHNRAPREEGKSAPPDFTQPLFVDSGGFKLLNNSTFSDAPSAGGEPNDWDIYTEPESILDLQLDYGADIIATLDYPIPPDLNKKETNQRMEDSIDSAIRCLELLEDRDANPAVYVAIHGHDYETINWYVGQFLNRSEGVDASVEGFAVGSLVPVRNDVATLIDIIQGAKDAIPEGRESDLALHVFGVGGRICSLLALLGVDSFDSSSYLQAARYKKVIHPETWEKIKAEDLDEEWSCDCTACRGLDLELMNRVLYSDTSYKPIEGYMKSDFYALIAEHNFEVYQNEIKHVRNLLGQDDGALLDYIADLARSDIDLIAKGLDRAQVRDSELTKALKERGHDDLIRTVQTTLPGTNTNVESDSNRTISLQWSPEDFDVLQNGYQPPEDKSVLVFIPCSQKKPYGESRTHTAVFDELEDHRDRIHKVTVSGLYGPVPEEHETAEPVLSYEFVLTDVEEAQQELVTRRLRRYLEQHGDNYDVVLAYAVSKNYRKVIEEAFADYEGDATLYPKDPKMLRLTEHFRGSNIDELVERISEWSSVAH